MRTELGISVYPDSVSYTHLDVYKRQEEGFVRELVSKIQTMRKEAGFEVTDRIHVYVKDSQKIESIIKAHESEIKGEVLAQEITFGTTSGYEKRCV